MAGFKVGDRVEYAGNFTGTLIQEGALGTVVGIDRDGRYQVRMDEPRADGFSIRNKEGREFHWTMGGKELRPAPAPRKDVPKVGDIVRVVLEGRVAPTGDACTFYVEGPHGNHIDPAQGHVKSIEILKPAEPSVKDLPDRSVIRDTLDVVAVKTGENYWVATNGGVYGDADFDQRGWILLVPQESA